MLGPCARGEFPGYRMLTATTGVEKPRLAPRAAAHVVVRREGTGKKTVLSWKPKRECFQEVIGHLY